MRCQVSGDNKPAIASTFERVGKGYAAVICVFKGKEEMAYIAPNSEQLKRALDLHHKTYNPALFQRVIITADLRCPPIPQAAP